jgi:hypothetical protein
VAVPAYYVAWKRVKLLRNGEVKRGALAELRLNPDFPAELLDNALRDRQTDSRAWELAAMQPLEDPEDLFVVARIDADAVVANRELDLVDPVDGGNMNPGRLRTTEHN